MLSGLGYRTLKDSARALALATAALLALFGCGKEKADVQSQTSAVEKAFPDLAAVTPASVSRSTPTGDPRAYVSTALSAVRSNDLATGVIMLKQAMRLPGLTVPQIQALQEARNAWMGDLSERAVRGEEKARAALAAIDQAE